MADSGKSAIPIEPLTKAEQKERGEIPRTNVEDDPNFEKDWIGKDIAKMVQDGF